MKRPSHAPIEPNPARIASIVITVLAVLGGSPPLRADDAPRPNIVFVMADDLGYGDLRAYNPSSKIPTPHTDKLAKQGMLFTDAHSGSAVCTPTRYGVITGRYAWRSRLKRGVLGGYSTHLIDAKRLTVGKMLQKAGYATACVGKWHLGMDFAKQNKGGNTNKWDGDPGIDYSKPIAHSPITRGFDEYFGVSASLDMPPYIFIRNDRFTSTDLAQQPALGFPDYVRKGPRAKDLEFHSAQDVMTEAAVAYIKKAAQTQKDGGKPFFLYFPLTGPHKPVTPAKRFLGKSKLGPYGDFVMQIDWTIGQVNDALEAAGVADNTLLIVTSDNGSFMYRYEEAKGYKRGHVADPKVQAYLAKHHTSNGPLRGTKADVYEAGHRVPWLVKWPAKVKPGSRSAATICHVDLMATAAEVAGVEIPDTAGEDSFSILSALLQEPGKDMKRASVINHSAAGMFAIREGKWKLIAGNGSGGREKPRGKPFGKPFMLFDLEADLGETKDLAKDKPEVVERLTKKLEALRSAGRSR